MIQLSFIVFISISRESGEIDKHKGVNDVMHVGLHAYLCGVQIFICTNNNVKVFQYIWISSL